MAKAIQVYLTGGNDSKQSKKKKAKRLISIRLDEDLIHRIKAIAAQEEIPYQKLIRIWIEERASQP